MVGGDDSRAEVGGTLSTLGDAGTDALGLATCDGTTDAPPDGASVGPVVTEVQPSSPDARVRHITAPSVVDLMGR